MGEREEAGREEGPATSLAILNPIFGFQSWVPFIPQHAARRQPFPRELTDVAGEPKSECRCPHPRMPARRGTE